MAFLIDKKLEYLHVPKTAGIWFYSALKELNIDKEKIDRVHSNHDQTVYYKRLGSGRFLLQTLLLTVANRIGFQYETRNIYPKFFMVRNPFSWYESWWRFSKIYADHLALINCEVVIVDENEDFNSYLSRIIKHHPGHLTHLLNSFDKKYTLHIGRFENLLEDICEILNLYDIKIPQNALEKIPPSNVSKKDSLEWDLDLKKSILFTEMPSFIKYAYITPKQLDRLGIKSDVQYSPKLISNKVYDRDIAELL